MAPQAHRGLPRGWYCNGACSGCWAAQRWLELAFAAVVPAHEQMRITLIAEDIRKLSRAMSALKREHSVARPAEG
ncbi:hypothetical protein GCM10022207_90960 [Streptomyces lannensis]|uniref:Uncharacterized protein n=1 Tax=Streptomyces lannensis TaxID=766498 RepID=A0ABP7LRN1_9ACTN